MKKATAILLAALFFLGGAVTAASAEGGIPTESINLRDPCVLAHEGTYYMYGTGAAWPGYGCYTSRDLESWAGPFAVFTPPAGFDGVGDWWAPECHEYQGRFYLFASYKSAATGHRGVSVFRGESPLGPFEEISDGHITPKDWDAIDGTLFVDGDGQPWLVFVHEWTSMPDGVGDFTCAKLSADLSRLVSEPAALFKASKLPRNPKNPVTDGCWLHRTQSGQLLMLWSGFGDGYTVAQAVSLSGKVTGPWLQMPILLYQKNSAFPKDGGHGALFHTVDGALTLSIHSPNGPGGEERAAFYPVSDHGASLILEGNNLPLLRRVGAGLWNGLVRTLQLFYS
jgi:beta-xylosidase